MAQGTGNRLDVIPFEDWLRSMDLGVAVPQVLVHETGHLYVFLGAF